MRAGQNRAPCSVFTRTVMCVRLPVWWAGGSLSSFLSSMLTRRVMVMLMMMMMLMRFQIEWNENSDDVSLCVATGARSRISVWPRWSQLNNKSTCQCQHRVSTCYLPPTQTYIHTCVQLKTYGWHPPLPQILGKLGNKHDHAIVSQIIIIIWVMCHDCANKLSPSVYCSTQKSHGVIQY